MKTNRFFIKLILNKLLNNINRKFIGILLSFKKIFFVSFRIYLEIIIYFYKNYITNIIKKI
jgi:hypothetical protein